MIFLLCISAILLQQFAIAFADDVDDQPIKTDDEKRVEVSEFLNLFDWDEENGFVNLFDWNKEVKQLHAFMCGNKEFIDGYRLRTNENWRKIAKIDDSKIPEEFLGDWRLYYRVVERLFNYCNYLQKCISEFVNEHEALQRIAIVPTFGQDEDNSITLATAMEKIMEAFDSLTKIRFIPKIVRTTFKDIIKLPFLVLMNKDNCTKIAAWALLLKKGNANTKERALTNLRSAKETLQLHSNGCLFNFKIEEPTQEEKMMLKKETAPAKNDSLCGNDRSGLSHSSGGSSASSSNSQKQVIKKSSSSSNWKSSVPFHDAIDLLGLEPLYHSSELPDLQQSRDTEFPRSQESYDSESSDSQQSYGQELPRSQQSYDSELPRSQQSYASELPRSQQSYASELPRSEPFYHSELFGSQPSYNKELSGVQQSYDSKLKEPVYDTE